jgi:hypothetical protein
MQLPVISNENGYLKFERSINRADNITNAFIITAGDFNLPGWDWKTKSLKANTQHVNIHHKFTDLLRSFYLYERCYSRKEISGCL